MLAFIDLETRVVQSEYGRRMIEEWESELRGEELKEDLRCNEALMRWGIPAPYLYREKLRWSTQR